MVFYFLPKLRLSHIIRFLLLISNKSQLKTRMFQNLRYKIQTNPFIVFLLTSCIMNEVKELSHFPSHPPSFPTLLFLLSLQLVLCPSSSINKNVCNILFFS